MINLNFVFQRACLLPKSTKRYTMWFPRIQRSKSHRIEGYWNFHLWSRWRWNPRDWFETKDNRRIQEWRWKWKRIFHQSNRKNSCLKVFSKQKHPLQKCKQQEIEGQGNIPNKRLWNTTNHWRVCNVFICLLFFYLFVHVIFWLRFKLSLGARANAAGIAPQTRLAVNNSGRPRILKDMDKMYDLDAHQTKKVGKFEGKTKISVYSCVQSVHILGSINYNISIPHL